MKLLYILNVANCVNNFSYASMVAAQKLGIEFHIAGNWGYKTDVEREEDEKKYGIKIFQIDFIRSPYDLRNVKAYRQLSELVEKGHYDIIHCNTPIGGVFGRIVGKQKKVPIVIYQAHGFHFYTGAPWLNWLIYFPVEWICSWFTDVLITINTEDYELAKKHMHVKKILYIPGVGIDLDKFKKKDLSEEETQAKRQELGLKPEDKMLLSVGELNKNKNHEVVIRALAELKDENIQYYIAGKGQLEEYLKGLVKKLGISKQVHFFGYRGDIAQLLQLSDLYIFPSHREGLSVSLMEAIACQVPVICSDIRGNRDLVIDEGLFNQKDVKDVANKITKFLEDDNVEEVRLNYENLQKFSLVNVLEDMRKVYGE